MVGGTGVVLRFEVFDYDNDGTTDYIGYFECTLSRLATTNAEFEIINPRKRRKYVVQLLYPSHVCSTPRSTTMKPSPPPCNTNRYYSPFYKNSGILYISSVRSNVDQIQIGRRTSADSGTPSNRNSLKSSAPELTRSNTEMSLRGSTDSLKSSGELAPIKEGPENSKGTLEERGLVAVAVRELEVGQISVVSRVQSLPVSFLASK